MKVLAGVLYVLFLAGVALGKTVVIVPPEVEVTKD